MKMKFTMLVAKATDPTKTWMETYEKFLKDDAEVLQWCEKTIKNFNATLRPHETARVLVDYTIQERPPKNALMLHRGRTYRAKNVRNSMGYKNDRTIVWMDNKSVQYDSPSVKLGQKRPTISIEKFLTWAKNDVTDTLPDGEYEKFIV